MLIIADSREPENIRVGIQQVCLEAGVQYTSTKLDVGDYWVHQGKTVVCVERKTIPDLHRSVTSPTGRWPQQVRNMSQALNDGVFSKAILLLEGMAYPQGTGIKHTRGYIEWPYSAFQSTLLSAQLAGLMILTTVPSKLPESLITIGKWASKKHHSSLVRQLKPVILQGNNAILVSMLMALPGVGEVTATALAKQFTSIAGVLSASQADIAKVPGIGPVTARRIYQALRAVWNGG